VAKGTELEKNIRLPCGKNFYGRRSSSTLL